MRLLVLRHGETTWNLAGRWQGWIDVELSEIGEEQARRRGAQLAAAGIGFATIVASDLARAARTAELVAAELVAAALVAAPAGELPVRRHPGLRERAGGEFEGLDAEAIDAGWPGFRDRWRAGLEDAPPGGESDAVVWARVEAVLAELHAEPAAEPVLLVTHGGVARILSEASGNPTRAVTPNVGGRWYEWDGARLLGGEVLEPLPDTDRTRSSVE